MGKFARYALSIGAVALIAGCGGSQQLINASGAMPQSRAPMARSNSSNYQLLYSFAGPKVDDGASPNGPLIDVHGTFYGTTAFGGRYHAGSEGDGTVFSMTPGGTEKVLHSFRCGVHHNRTDGCVPTGRLIDVGGKLYGTTAQGGAYNAGTLFRITPSGREKVLYSFGYGTDGKRPTGSLIDVNGTLYGTTINGGSGPSGGEGTVFSVTLGGTEKVLYSFAGGSDGAAPTGPLVEVNGTLYGTTLYGGGGPKCVAEPGCGTVYSITLSGSETVLYRFDDGTDGADPNGGLTDVNGTLYGTTAYGGSVRGCFNGYGCGTVFSMSTTGSESVLHSFGSGSDGITPGSGLTNVKGTLYGTTIQGGGYDAGTVFSITTGGTENVVYSFTYLPSSFPGRLIDVGGTLYGTTQIGGAHRYGTVYTLTL